MHLGKHVTHETVTLGLDASIVDAAQIMRTKHVGSVIAIDENRRPVGILTDRDIVVGVVAQDPEDLLRLSVRDVCTPGPIVALEDEDLDAVMARMRRYGIRRVPVVDREGLLVGVFSMDDALAALARELAGVTDLLRNERAHERTRRGAK